MLLGRVFPVVGFQSEGVELVVLDSYRRRSLVVVFSLMLAFLEFLIGLLDVADYIPLTGEWVLSLFGRKSNFVVQFLIGLLVWVAGVVLVAAVAYALSGK